MRDGGQFTMASGATLGLLIGIGVGMLGDFGLIRSILAGVLIGAILGLLAEVISLPGDSTGGRSG